MSDWNYKAQTSGAGIQRHVGDYGHPVWFDGWVATEQGYVVIYAEARGKNSAFLSLRFIHEGRVHDRSMRPRRDPTQRGIATVAARFAREFAASIPQATARQDEPQPGRGQT